MISSKSAESDFSRSPYLVPSTEAPSTTISEFSYSEEIQCPLSQEIADTSKSLQF